MKKLCIILIFALLCLFCSCDSTNNEREAALAAARDSIHKYDFLDSGVSAILSLDGMLSYYNDASYQAAKKTAKISDAVEAQYFPYVKWQGSEFLAIQASAEIGGIYLISYTDSVQHFNVAVRYVQGDNIPRTRLYDVKYSAIDDEIIACDLLLSAKSPY